MSESKTMNYEVASQSSSTGEKKHNDVENASLPPAFVENNDGMPVLTEEHRDYLIKRHGTVDLDPLPSADPADPYNWPQWKKVVNLSCVAFHVSSGRSITLYRCPADTHAGYDDHFHRLRHHSCFRGHCRRIRRITSQSRLSDLTTNRHPRLGTLVLEANRQSLRSSSCVAHQHYRIPCVQHRLCQEQLICYHGYLQSIYRILHQPSWRHWLWCCHRDFLQEGACYLRWHVDATCYSWPA